MRWRGPTEGQGSWLRSNLITADASIPLVLSRLYIMGDYRKDGLDLRSKISAGETNLRRKLLEDRRIQPEPQHEGCRTAH